ncbi:hypothetical protein KXS11_12780 [Plantibacter flavus]|uniref:hypothetical protein n=1 Tax=Plantibacter flavus TaxID=150123 RepID=UPI003F1592C0
MNSTNRFLNRMFIFVVGLIALAAGAAVSVGAVLPDVQKTVSDNAERAVTPTVDTIAAQPWILWVAAVAAALLIVLLLWFVLRQGHGHTGTLLQVGAQRSRNTPTGGSVTLDVTVAARVLEEAVGRNPDVVSVDVTGFRIRGQRTLRLTVHARRGSSPVRIRRAVDAVVTEWDGVLGAETPVVVQIVSGLRTRFASTNRVV